MTCPLSEPAAARALPPGSAAFLEGFQHRLYKTAGRPADFTAGVALLQKPENLTRFDVRCILNVMPFEGAVKAYATGGAL